MFVRHGRLHCCAFAMVFGFALGTLVPTAAAEPLKLALGVDLALAMTAPTDDEFLPGGQVTVGAFMPLLPQLLLGGRFGVGGLLNGHAPQDPGRVDPGLGGLITAQLVGRVRPFASSDDPRRGDGLFVEGSAGGAVTGELVRPTVGLSLGWGFPMGDITLAAVVRYQQVIQGSDPIDSRDARLAMLGLELMFGESEPTPDTEPIVEASDRDGDGLLDDADGCPDEAEDFDSFEDEDGCPDTDNDKDGVLDADDRCPNVAEDKDGFEDADGCPDPDNDRDGFLDADDECPNDAEVVNGVSDYDGCPDEGLITMVDDRIILDERVLFDFERSRVKSRAKPVLQAIVTLHEQHPEWVSVRVEGHADARGDAAFNQDLSERRAQNVREALVELGISASLIDSVGYGATRLRDLRENEEAHQRNRRVEFVVIARRQEVVDAGGMTDEPTTPASPDETTAPAETTPPATSPEQAQEESRDE